MPFPRDVHEMKAQGYVFDNDGLCRGCGSPIEWWKTPAGKSMPMDPMNAGTDKAMPHWKTCSDAASFRKK